MNYLVELTPCTRSKYAEMSGRVIASGSGAVARAPQARSSKAKGSDDIAMTLLTLNSNVVTLLELVRDISTRLSTVEQKIQYLDTKSTTKGLHKAPPTGMGD